MPREVKVLITGDQSSLNKAFGQAAKDADSFASKLTKVGDSMASVGKKMTVGLTLPIVALGKKSLDAFAEVERVGAQTSAVLASTGQAAHVGAAEIEKLATNVSKLGAVDDEAVQAGENLLLTFTNVRNEVGAGNDIFSQATVLMADMSQALGQDLTTSAMQLGKALNDPIAGVTALRRVGVQLSDQQEEQIKKFVEQGDVLSAQKVILAELNREFAGSAAAFAKTDTGKAKAAMIELGNAMERLGAILAPIVTKIANFLAQLATKFQALSPHTQEMIVKALAIAAAVGPLLIVLGKLASTIGLVGKAIMFLAANPIVLIIAAIIAAVVLLTVLIVKNWDTIKAFLINTWNTIKETAAAVWNAIVEIAKSLWDSISKAILGPIMPIGTILKIYWDLIKLAAIVAWNSLRAGAQAIWEGIKTVIINPIMWVVRQGIDAFNNFKSQVVSAFNAIKGPVAAVVGFVVEKLDWLLGRARAIAKSIGEAIHSGLKLIMPGSPIPIVVHAQAAVDGVAAALGDLPGAARDLLGGGATSGQQAASAAQAATAAGGVTVPITINGDVTGQEVVDKVQTSLLKFFQQNGLAPVGG